MYITLQIVCSLCRVDGELIVCGETRRDDDQFDA